MASHLLKDNSTALMIGPRLEASILSYLIKNINKTLPLCSGKE